MSAVEAQRRWDAITSIATLGTNRAAPPAESLWPVADPPAPQGSSERDLLRAAAMNYLWLLAGARQPATQSPAVDYAPRADERLVSEKAVWRLGRMLNGEHRELVAEWLELASRAGAVLPPHWLPVALTKLKDVEKNLARPVLGSTAEWLAKRNPEWAFAVAPKSPSDEQWDYGTLPERCAALRSLHVVDPGRARAWLSSTWKTEPPEARAAFVEVLAESPALAGEDETFLEAALDDKRKEVRRAAAASLRRLPGSAHAARNLERLQPLVVLEAAGTGLLSKLSRRRLQVNLPEALSKSAVRDGIEQTPPVQRKIGERAFWLTQMIAMVQPSHWTERFDCDIATFLKAVQATDYVTDLVLALSEAAAQHADVAWISALCKRLADIDWKEGPPELWSRIGQAMRSLVAAAPEDQRRAIVQQIFDDVPDARFVLIIDAYDSAGLRWDEALTRRAFSQLGRQVLTEGERFFPGSTYPDWARLAEVATAMPMLADIIERSASNSPWRKLLESLRETLQFRADMQQELLK